MQGRASAQLARIEAPSVNEMTAHGVDVPMPAEVEAVKGLNTIDKMETNPTVVFDTVGDYIIGRYLGPRVLTIGNPPRQQTLYDLRTPSGVVVSVWGSTILDRRMKEAIGRGLVVNQSLMVQYLGDIPTDNPSPAKNFRVSWK